MSKKIGLNQWKPVKIDGAAFNNSLEGLLGIEECTNYDLNTILLSKKQARKRKPDVGFNTKILVPKKKIKIVKQKHEDDTDLLIPSKNGSSDMFKSEDLEEHFDFESVKAWSTYGLPDPIIKALALLKFKEPTQIQSLTLPAALMGKRDILGAAETGSGKTLAFGLPILFGIMKLQQKILKNNKTTDQLNHEDSEETTEPISNDGLGCVRVVNNICLNEEMNSKPLYALILTPTRELAVQIKNHLAAVARFTNINIAVVVGGMAVEKQERILSKGPEIVVATPGRLWELIQQGNPHLTQINNIKFLAIDETDRMIERGHFQELHDILEKINADEEKKKLRQNFVFSATLTLVHELPQYLVTKKKLMKGKIADVTQTQKLLKIVELLGITDPKCVDITLGKGTSGTLTECRITCSIERKDYYLYYFLQRHPGRTLVFCNSIGCVRRLTTIMGLLKCNPLPLHASMQQRQRLKNLDRFKENENGILIATDVAARGLDIPCVEHVIHYQTPRTSESYVHRSGRTARALRQGITVLLVEPSELQSYLRLCRTLGKTEDIPIFPVDENLLEAVKFRVNLARELDKLELQVKKVNSQTGWFQKAADEMDIVLDDESYSYDKSETQKVKKAADLKRKELYSALARPLFPKGFSGKYPLSTGELIMPMIQGERAIEVMNCALKDVPKKVRVKKPKFLFKPKIKAGAEVLTSKLKTENKKIKFNRNKKKAKVVKK